MLNDEEAKQLVDDAGRMARELQLITKSDPDTKRREQAKRWLSTIRRMADYAVQCRGGKR